VDDDFRSVLIIEKKQIAESRQATFTGRLSESAFQAQVFYNYQDPSDVSRSKPRGQEGVGWIGTTGRIIEQSGETSWVTYTVEYDVYEYWIGRLPGELEANQRIGSNVLSVGVNKNDPTLLTNSVKFSLVQEDLLVAPLIAFGFGVGFIIMGILIKRKS